MSPQAFMTGAQIATGIGQSIAGLGSAVIQGEYNKKLQEEANNFTREQSQNQIKYNVKQLEDLGISPLMLFDHGNATGGGAGGGKIGASAPNYAEGIIAGLNTVGKILRENERLDLEERKIDMIEKANKDKFEFLDKQEKNRNSYREKLLNNQILNKQKSDGFAQRNYTKEDFDNVYDSLDDIII